MQFITTKCEYIAMSLLVDALTDGQAPLLVNEWAIRTIIKFYVEWKISGELNHLVMRSAYVQLLATILALHTEQKIH